MSFQIPFADRLNNVETSAIRELFKLLGKPGIISFAGGFPDSAMFDVDGIREAVNAALTEEAGGALQYGATEGYQPLREQLAAFMASKGAHDVAANDLIVTTGSQQGLDLLGKTLISPGDKVIVEGPTFLATIQCFRLYGAELISAPVDGDGVKTDVLERLIAEHKPKFVYLIPTFGNPSGAMLSQARRQQVLEMAVKHNTLIVEDDPYGDLYFGDAPPPSLLAMSSTVPGSRERLVHCGSLSKVLSPGLRVGWMVGPAELLAKATIANPQGLLRNGQRLRTRVILGAERQWAVPFAAVTRSFGQNFVFVLGTLEELERDPGKADLAALRRLPKGTLLALQKPVNLGPLQGEIYPVLSGINANDRVILSGNLGLRHGSPVRLQP